MTRRLLLLLILGCLAGTCSVDGLVVSGYLLHRPPPRPITVVACDVEPSLRELVQRDRLIRRSGIGAGAVLVATTASIGSSAGVVDAGALLPLVLAGGVLAGSATYARFLSNEESQQACPDDFFTVAESPGKGKGLFATCAIEQGTFLFDYQGEILNEEQFFARYPNADGRYIAGLTDNYYIDGADPELSNMARWMNHAGSGANVMWKKQRLGPSPAMHFYSTAPIRVGEELCFDYGSEYWEALGVTPL